MTATAAEWGAYFDLLEVALKGVALAVAHGEPPPWPARLAVPAGPVPPVLAARQEAGVRALRSIIEVTGEARDGVAAEIGRLARTGAGRELGSGRTSTATLGSRFDAAG